MKAVLLIHGFLTDEDDFAPIYEKLKDNYDHIVSLILPGHYHCEEFRDFKMEETFSKMFNCFDELQKKYTTIDVIGYSLGGALATYLSTMREFNKLVLLAPANKFLNIAMPLSRIMFLIKAILQKFGGQPKDDDLYQFGNVLTNDYRSIQFAFKQLIPNYSYHTLTTFIRIINTINQRVREIKNPTLIIWGKMDQLVPKSSVVFDFKLCVNKNKRLIILDDISHLMLQSIDATRIISEIMDFLRAN